MSDKIMGKYDNVEQLENAYKGLKSQYDQLANGRNKFTIPDTYNTEKYEFVDPDLLERARGKAETYGYTQAQFDKEMRLLVDNKRTKEEKSKAFKTEFEDIDHLKEFVTKELGLDERVFGKLDADDLKGIRERREKSLSTKTKVGSSSSGAVKDPRAKISEAFREMTKARGQGNEKLFQEKFAKYTKACQAVKAESK